MDSDGHYGLLRKPERRIIIRELVDYEGPTTIESLVAAIVAHCTDHDERSARIRLYHIDLPKLKEAGILDYDPRNGDVVLCESAEELTQYLDGVETKPTPAVVQ